jgi:alkylation response protein AidB-like acyl-CoA dehydrogenase
MPADFVFTDEHDELRQTVRAFLAKRSDEKAVRATMVGERGYDPEVWKQLAEELGLVGLIIPEEHGGAGYGPVELLIAMEEMGRALLCAPYLGTSVFAAQTLLTCADAVTQKELLPKIASGAAIVSVAFAEPNGRWAWPASAFAPAARARASRSTGRRRSCSTGSPPTFCSWSRAAMRVSSSCA